MSITGGGGQIEFAFPSGACASGTVWNQPVAPVAVNQAAAIPLRCKPTAVGAEISDDPVHRRRHAARTGPGHG